MQKNELLQYENRIVRVLELKDNQALAINCMKRTMPTWTDISQFDGWNPCNDAVLLEATGFVLQCQEELDPVQLEVMHERFTMIAPSLPCIGDVKERSIRIREAAEEYGVTTQTVRKHLCLYLVYLDICALAPQSHNEERGLTQDEENMRWALNKFFYTTQKQSLNTAYVMMLKEKYCDNTGTLLDVYPSFYQFRYFYRRTRNMQNFYISRNGLTDYQRNERPLIGGGVQEFAPAIGVGMLDATVCDIYLVDDSGCVVGRPILTVCVDAHSGLCCGYHLSWEGGVHSLTGLMLNVITDKPAWCAQFGIGLERSDWECNMLPATLVTDMGSEYASHTFEQITELGVRLVNLPPYRPELKGPVEKLFDLLQSAYKTQLKGMGVVEPDYQERGVHDYRRDARLTMQDFEKIILRSIIYCNSQRVIHGFPYTEAMLEAQVPPYASAIWNRSKGQQGANLISVDEHTLILTLLPRTTGRFGRTGLKVGKLHYHCEGYTEHYLRGGTVTVAYNPDDATSIWLVEDGRFTEFRVVEARFERCDLTTVEAQLDATRTLEREAEKDSLQARISLATHIETIAANTGTTNEASLKDIRKTRKKEQNRRHTNYMEER